MIPSTLPVDLDRIADALFAARHDLAEVEAKCQPVPISPRGTVPTFGTVGRDLAKITIALEDLTARVRIALRATS